MTLLNIENATVLKGKLRLSIEQFLLNSGEIHVIKGANGAGKSVFLRYLRRVSKESLYISQFVPAISENVKQFYTNVFNMSGIALPEFERLDEITELDTLSTGQRQMLNLKMALHAAPKILLVDEALSNIDEANLPIKLQELQDYLQKHQATAVLVNHFDLSKYLQNPIFWEISDGKLRRK